MFTHEKAEKVRAWLDDWRFDPLIITPVVLLLLVVVALLTDPTTVSATFTGVVLLSPLWLPLFLFVTLWTTWIHYIRYVYFFKLNAVLLEIQLPPEVEKSPLAIEVILLALLDHSGESTFLSRFWYGKSRITWSLEIASNEGRISFYIRVSRPLKNVVESVIYGQFPDAKVMEVQDYTRAIHFNLEEYELWGTEYQKMPGKPQALPIKTYIDYELDKNTDVPETKVEPLTNLFELMGSLGEGQYLWTQIIMQVHRKEEWYGIHRDADSWKDNAKAEITKIMAGAAKRAQEVLKESEVVEGKMNALLTDREKKSIEAIEHQLSKPVFECGIRTLTFAKKGRFVPATVPGIVLQFSPFFSIDFNRIIVAANRQFTSFDYPWQDWNGIRQNITRKKLFFFYQNRAYFKVPYDQVPVLLTPEEVASIWHFPNSSVKTPALQRVQSKRAEAPQNLPI